AVGLSADCVYHPALSYQPGWAALPLGLVELGGLMGIVLLLGVRAPVLAALALFGGAWVWTQLLGQALLPSWRWGYAEDGGELGVAGAALAAAICLPFAASGGIWWHNLPPTVRLAAGVHQGPLYVDRRERLVGAPGAIVLGGIVVRHDDVKISHVTVIGGENGIAVSGVSGVVLDHVTVVHAKLDGIHVRRAADVDPVELRMHDGDVVEHDAAHTAHRDSVLTADHRDVADLHVVVADDDTAQHDRAGRTDEPLTAVDVEGSLVDAGRQPDGRRQVVPPDPAGGRERQADRRRECRAGDPELAAILGVAPTPR